MIIRIVSHDLNYWRLLCNRLMFSSLKMITHGARIEIRIKVGRQMMSLVAGSSLKSNVRSNRDKYIHDNERKHSPPEERKHQRAKHIAVIASDACSPSS